MHCQSFSRLHLLLIVPLTLLKTFGRRMWTQETPSAGKTQVQFASLDPQSVTFPEAGICSNPAYERLSPPIAPYQWSALLRFHLFDVGYLIPLINNYTLNGHWQLSKWMSRRPRRTT